VGLQERAEGGSRSSTVAYVEVGILQFVVLEEYIRLCICLPILRLVVLVEKRLSRPFLMQHLCCRLELHSTLWLSWLWDLQCQKKP
jgi:hypothetical protein